MERWPENGMGYRIVDIKIKKADHCSNYFKNVALLNDGIILWPERSIHFEIDDIEEIEIDTNETMGSRHIHRTIYKDTNGIYHER